MEGAAGLRSPLAVAWRRFGDLSRNKISGLASKRDGNGWNGRKTSERGRSSHWKGHFRGKRICTKFGISFTRKGDTKFGLERVLARNCYLILMLRCSPRSLTRRLGVRDGRDELFAWRGSTLTQHASMERKRKGSERQRRRRRRQRRPTNAPHDAYVRGTRRRPAGQG